MAWLQCSAVFSNSNFKSLASSFVKTSLFRVSVRVRVTVAVRVTVRVTVG